MTPDQLYTIIGSVVAVGISLAVLILRATSRIDRVQSEGAADRRALQASIDRVQSEGAADRRALQASMDTFRTEMQRLAERQPRLEGSTGD